MTEVVTDDAGPWRNELTDLARAVAGGLLFGVPLLYTMELWGSGQAATPVQSLAVLGVALVVVVALQRTSGFRNARDTRLVDAVIDAVDVVAVSAVLTTVLLVLLREITTATPLPVALGKIAHEALAFSIGAGVARHFLDERRDEGEGDATDTHVEEHDEATERGIDPTVADFGATAIGAVFIALNIAPTDEVPMLQSAVDAAWVLGVMLASLLISYVIVFVAGFAGEHQRRGQEGILQHPITETVVCYLVSLAAAGAMLVLFGRFDGPWTQSLSMTVLLGLPATVGGAAGRLAV